MSNALVWHPSEASAPRQEPPAPRHPLIIVLTGVSGSGKTTIGRLLAETLGWQFHDADEFHPPANIAKMSAGIPLNDDDRAPWLAAIRRHMEGCLARGENAVFTCSALRQAYRRAITVDPERVRLVQLAADYPLLLERMNRREGHFMKAEMLRSQFEQLEPPGDIVVVNAGQPPDAIVAQIRKTLSV